MCDENWKSKATMSSFMGGVMVGALLLGKLADRIGRRKNMALTTLGTLLFNTGYERLPYHLKVIVVRWALAIFFSLSRLTK